MQTASERADEAQKAADAIKAAQAAEAEKAAKAKAEAEANAPPTDAEIDATTPLQPPRCEKYMLYLLNHASVQFAIGKAIVSPASTPLIARLAHVAQRCPDAQLVVSGYTDNIGDAGVNKRLSKARADAVAVALAHAGVPVSRMETVGFGMDKPIASNDTEEGRAKNRRIEIHVK